MPVDSKHPDYVKRFPDWVQIADCVAGQRAIKDKGDEYLPRPNASDTSPENLARFDAYLQRAVFHNVTGRTVDNMVGQCFAADPVPTVPERMEPWIEDIDGAGVSATQFGKKALGLCVAMSRAGIWVTYPETNGATSQADEETGGVRPSALLFDPRKIINWKTRLKGAETVLSMIVLEGSYADPAGSDEFEEKLLPEYIVLRLDDAGLYEFDVYRKEGKGGTEGTESANVWGKHGETRTPTDGSGARMTEIPFVFIGAEANDGEVEKPLMLDISNLNIAHYMSSADHRESCYMNGQPTTWLAGLTQDWVENVLKGQVFFGSRACIPLPEGAAAGLLEANPNTMPKEDMERLEGMMIAIGAKLVEKKEVQKTATEAGIDEASATSILATCCNNVSAAIGRTLQWMAVFSNIEVADPAEELLFELNTDFAISRMSPDEQEKILSLFNGQLLTFSEARAKLVSGGVGYLTDEDAKDELEKRDEEDFKKAERDLALQQNSASSFPPAS